MIPTRKINVPNASMTPTLKYVVGGVPPCVTNNEPEMSSIEPAKNRINPRVANVSFMFSGPRKLLKHRINKLLTQNRPYGRATKH